MEMRDQYGLADLRQLMAGRIHFPAISQATEPFYINRNLTTPQHHYEMVGTQIGCGLVEFHPADSSTAATTTTTSAGALCGLEMEGGCIGGDGGNSRWPRQETLTLLEIRSRLDPKFKEAANQKGLLWDEVSRIMAEEHGYQRSGKKCKEKFENLYKYYKKTKEGKAGRQDGKHYRFFRQLDALYGETSNQASVSETHLVVNTLPFQTTCNTTINQANQDALQDQKLCESLSFSNSSEFETSSSENNDDDLSAIAFMMKHSTEKKKMVNGDRSYKRVRKSRKAKIRDFVDSHMSKLMETQEAWMEKMLKTIEHKEQERMSREEEWRKQEAARFDQEYKFLAHERAWVEARDSALMEALKKFMGKQIGSAPEELMAKGIQDYNKSMEDNVNEITHNTLDSRIIRWPEPELSNLIQLRTSMEPRIQESGYLKEADLWGEIGVKMAGLGYDQSALSCQEKWDNISIYFNKTMECCKKRKEDSRISTCFQQLNSYQSLEGLQPNDDGLSPSNSNMGTTMHGSCFRMPMNEGEQCLWGNYGVRISKGKNQQV